MIRILTINKLFITKKVSHIYTLNIRFTQTETITTTTTTSSDNAISNPPSPTIIPETNNDPSEIVRPMTFAEKLEAMRESNRRMDQSNERFQIALGKKQVPATEKEPISPTDSPISTAPANSQQPLTTKSDANVQSPLNPKTPSSSQVNTEKNSDVINGSSSSSLPSHDLTVREISLIAPEDLSTLKELKKLEEIYAKLNKNVCTKKERLHPFTAKFLKDPYSILTLLNKPGQNFVQIQQLSKNIRQWPKPEELYNQDANILLDQPKTLMDILEINFVQRFRNLAKEGVIIGTYNIMKTKYGYTNLETMQMRPDLVSIWINNKSYKFKGYLGIDEKHKITSVTNYGRHQVINSIDYKNYQALLESFEKNLVKKQKSTPEMRYTLQKLRSTAEKNDFNLLLTIWSENLHLFPGKWKPPLMITKTFDETHIIIDILIKLRKKEVIVKNISDVLYMLNVSTETGLFPDEILNYFDNSIIEKLFGDMDQTIK